MTGFLNRIFVVIPGKPVGCPRPRFDPRSRRCYMPTEYMRYKQRVQAALRKAMLGGRHQDFAWAYVVQIDAYYKLPQSWSRAKQAAGLAGEISPGKPDSDNIEKTVLDAAIGVVYKDDARVRKTTTEKHFCRHGESERVEVTITYAPTDREIWR